MPSFAEGCSRKGSLVNSSGWERESSVSRKHSDIPACSWDATQHRSLPTDQGVSACWHQEHSSHLKLLRKHWDFFSTQKNFNTRMTNNLGRSKFPDVLQLLLSKSQGCFVGNAVLWEGGPQGRRRAASKEGSSSQEQQEQTFPNQNAWVWLHSMKSSSLPWKADAF